MGKTRYKRLQEILRPIVGKKIHLSKLQRRVMIEIGSSGTIVKESIAFMIELGLIKEVDNMVFKIVSDTADI